MKVSFLSTIVSLSLFQSSCPWSLSSNGVEFSRRDAIPKVLFGSAAAPFVLSTYLGDTSAVAATDLENEYITTDRGIKYKVTSSPKDTQSPTPQRAQKVKAKYTLYLNGFPEDTDKAVKIDSSKGLFGEKPFEFLAGVSQVIKGWDLTIMEMREGEARKLIIPSNLGYGEKGAGGKIPGGATLYFDVELAEIGSLAKLGPEQVKWLEEHPL
mmetsp:Transcript_27673/g.33654  ORF Transcript_27673/g.33654 Transcript_27673/m.33654 type:complete len:211 (-) Transcript_27673:77-709(-)|eukprot:CAMPEP_0172499838 /NCGR_PEP_ID=MMETSP1066-20121228/131667_1 /TAXON_ID=671091 /ORGANISM="Coscinodiscus wailesii, Strain CCMP2513" /LENGTH=210 /DNA_ID=CAMNT_0013273795 /DNA_START=31 /DNA_END=663 /DNA_ORIENTATION=+